MTDGNVKPVMLVGGVGCILWLVGALIAFFLLGIGQILLGIGVLIASFGTLGLWQRDKDVLAMVTFILKLLGGVLLMIGGILITANIGVGAIVGFIGQFILAVALIALGIIINKHGPRLSLQNILGMDLVLPGVVASIASGCAAMGAAVTVTIPAAAVLGAVFFLAK